MYRGDNGREGSGSAFGTGAASERGEKVQYSCFYRGRRREREKWKVQGQHRIRGEVEGKACMLGQGRQRKRERGGMIVHTAVDNVHRQLFFIYIISRLGFMGFVALDIFPGFAVR